MASLKNYPAFIDILGVKISAVDLPLACTFIEEMVVAKRKAYVCVAPVSTLVDCQRIEGYRGIINDAALVTPDGMPVVWLCHLKGARHVRRAYGPDLMRSLCGGGSLRHFFYGGNEETLVRMQEQLRRQNPDLIVAGTFAPGIIPARGALESQPTIEMINRCQADIIWVGLGSPKQDFWMKFNRPHLNAPVLIGIGAAFDFISGQKAQAPLWMQEMGLEWVFRFYSEPRRLWRRYLIGNSLFIFYLLRSLFIVKQNPKN